MSWVAEPETVAETQIEMAALEADLRRAKAECCDKQAQILEMEADWLYLSELLKRQIDNRVLATASGR